MKQMVPDQEEDQREPGEKYMSLDWCDGLQ